mmetsp:Transcript_419/g.840  ORF Transcript_419/g.840 Transcript_419/m.840 type:complete len:199 (-) Transcript_419:77-673(-)
MSVQSALMSFAQIPSLLKGGDLKHLAVMAPTVNEYGDNQTNYDWFIAFQVVGILAGALLFLETDQVEIAVGLMALNIIDWTSVEYIREEANKVLAGDASIVDFIQTKQLLEVLFYIVPTIIIAGSIYMIAGSQNEILLAIFGSLIAFTAIEAYTFYVYMEGINEMIDRLGFGTSSGPREDDRGYYETDNEGDKYYFFD